MINSHLLYRGKDFILIGIIFLNRGVSVMVAYRAHDPQVSVRFWDPPSSNDSRFVQTYNYINKVRSLVVEHGAFNPVIRVDSRGANIIFSEGSSIGRALGLGLKGCTFKSCASNKKFPPMGGLALSIA